MTHENYSKIVYYTLAGVAGLALITAGAIIGHKFYKKGLQDCLELYYRSLEKGTE